MFCTFDREVKMPASGAGQHYAGMGSNPIVCIFLIILSSFKLFLLFYGIRVGSWDTNE